MWAGHKGHTHQLNPVQQTLVCEVLVPTTGGLLTNKTRHPKDFPLLFDCPLTLVVLPLHRCTERGTKWTVVCKE